MQPREIRDIAIECMGRLNGTAATVKEACTEAFFLRYRSACGQVMGGFVDIINAVVHLHPDLKPGDGEWVRVASRRREDLALPAGLCGHELVEAEVETTAAHLRQLREQNEAFLMDALDDVDANLPKLMSALKDWAPRP